MVSLLSPITSQIFENFMKQVNYLYFFMQNMTVIQHQLSPAHTPSDLLSFAYCWIYTVCFAN